MPCPGLAEPVRGEAEMQGKACWHPASCRRPAAARAQTEGTGAVQGAPLRWQAVRRQQGGQLTKKLGAPFHSSKFKRVWVLYVYASEEVSITEREV